MLPRVDGGNQHRVGKRICRALQQRCFGPVMARRLPAFDPQALGSMRVASLTPMSLSSGARVN